MTTSVAAVRMQTPSPVGGLPVAPGTGLDLVRLAELMGEVRPSFPEARLQGFPGRQRNDLPLAMEPGFGLWIGAEINP